MELVDKIKRVLEGIISIKNMLTKTGNVSINFLTINVGNKSEYVTLREDFDPGKIKEIQQNPEWDKIVEQKILETLKPLEDRINTLVELEQFHLMTNAATKTIEAMFYRQENSSTSKVEIETKKES